MKVFEMQELEAATESFSPSRLIGKGSHGSIYRGVLKDGTHIAVKKQSLGLQKLRDYTKLENEACILSSLSPNNPCIINLLGTSTVAGAEKVIVTEYMTNGTLYDILHSSFPTTVSPLASWRTRVEIAIQIAKGVSFLHGSSPPIVHRDIKSSNILFDENLYAKLADFGLAMRLNSDDDEEEVKLPAGTIGYIDPSYTTPSKLSTKIDVFSYGVVLLELISGRKAIDVQQSPPSIIEWALPLVERGRMMEVCDKSVRWPRFMGHKMLGLASRCLSPKQNVRPSMDEIVVILENLMFEPIRVPFLMNFIHDMILSMMRRSNYKLGGVKCDAMVRITTSVRCASNQDRGGISGVGGSNMSKGTLLVREILADITLK